MLIQQFSLALLLFASLVLGWLVEVGNLPVEGKAVDILLEGRNIKVVSQLPGGAVLHDGQHARLPFLLLFERQLHSAVALDEVAERLVPLQVALFVALHELLRQLLLLLLLDHHAQLIVPLFDLGKLDLLPLYLVVHVLLLLLDLFDLAAARVDS